jgi:hypothetical protein
VKSFLLPSCNYTSVKWGGRTTYGLPTHVSTLIHQRPHCCEDLLAGPQDAQSEESRGASRKKKARRAREKRPTLPKASDSEAPDGDSDSDGFEDGYGSDLMGDEADRAKLMAMTELEREMELTERAERRDELVERKRAAKLLKQRQEEADAVRCDARSSRACAHQ